MTKDTEFTVVVRSKGKRNRIKAELPKHFTTLNINSSTTDDNRYDIDRTTQAVTENIQVVQESSLYKKLIENLPPTSGKSIQIVCFGLGSLSSYISRYQLALGVLLQRRFQAQTHFSDPCFTEQDATVLQKYQCSVLRENLEGKYKVAADPDYVTIFYLPHCPKQLTNNLLWKNWSVEQLSKIYLIANSFESILERSTSKVIQENAGFIEKISPYSIEFQLPEFEQAFEAFNDLALIKFERLNEVPEPDFWLQPSEPGYQPEDLEFVRNGN